MKDDRRKRNRLPWVRFESKVFVKRSLLKKEWIAVVPFDYSRYGVGIQTDEAYEVGDAVVMSLDLLREANSVTIPLINGIVRYKEKHHSRFNYGVEFVFESRAERRGMEEDLVRIEQTLRHYESTKSSMAGDVADPA